MQLKDYFFEVDFDIGISFKDPKLVCARSFEMNMQQTYRGLEFYVGWMIGTLVYNNSLIPS